MIGSSRVCVFQTRVVQSHPSAIKAAAEMKGERGVGGWREEGAGVEACLVRQGTSAAAVGTLGALGELPSAAIPSGGGEGKGCGGAAV